MVSILRKHNRSLIVYGERCSGTNLVEKLVVKNFRNITSRHDLGWKHGFYEPDVEKETDCLILIVARNPFDWVRSLYRNPWHASEELKGADFSSFIRMKWRCVWDEAALKNQNYILGPRYGSVGVQLGDELLSERDPRTGADFGNVLKLRSAKYTNWLELKRIHGNCHLVRFESVLDDSKGFVRKLGESLGQRPKWLFRNVRSYKGLGWRKYRPVPYPPLSAEDREHIVSQLDPRIEATLGYAIDG